jgi:hypothetical protein
MLHCVSARRVSTASLHGDSGPLLAFTPCILHLRRLLEGTFMQCSVLHHRAYASARILRGTSPKQTLWKKSKAFIS